MRKFKHVSLESIAEERGDLYYFNHSWGGSFIPKRFIENSNDWEEVKELDYEIIKSCPIEGSIFSVKRVSDGEIFTIGDKIDSHSGVFKINKINIFKKSVRFWADYTTSDSVAYTLKYVQKAKEPLLTTQDGIELFEGDVYYFIWLSSPASCQKINTVYNHILEPLANNTNWSENARFFAEKENAERYINLNSPKYSIKDIVPIVNNWAMSPCIDEDDILNFLAKNEK